jgi:hypothetical protein
VVDDALEPQSGAVFGGIDLGHAVGLQLPDLLRHDHAAPAAENLDVGGILFAQQVDHVLEELHVAPLVAGNGNALGILLDGGIHDLLNRAVVAQVDHLDARCPAGCGA